MEGEQKMRDNAARGIRMTRAKEMKDGLNTYEMERSPREYAVKLQGLKHLFTYAKTLPSKTVLDIGSGTTRGIYGISQQAISKGLSFEATTLSRSQTHSEFARTGHLSLARAVEKNLGWAKTHITSAEVLRGIPNASVGVVLSVFSLPYSKAPALAVQSIDRVLVDGGVFKGHFPVNNLTHLSAISYGPFEKEFERLGYSMSIDINPVTRRAVLLAIKPGGQEISAEYLLEQDRRDEPSAH